MDLGLVTCTNIFIKVWKSYNIKVNLIMSRQNDQILKEQTLVAKIHIEKSLKSIQS